MYGTVWKSCKIFTLFPLTLQLSILKLVVIQRDGFGENPWFRCLMAEELQFSEKNHSLPKRRAVGCTVFHNIYSTWEGRALFMVDLYVEPASRGKQ